MITRLRLLFLSILFLLPAFVDMSYGQQISEDRRGKGRQEKPDKENRGKGGGGGNRLANADPGNGNIVLGAPEKNSVVANILLEKGGEYFIEYGTVSNNYSSKSPVEGSLTGQPVELTLSGLKADTRYYYRLSYRVPGQNEFTRTAESWFSTQRSVGTEFSFGVQGDSHPERAGKMFSSAYYHQTIRNVSAAQPDFYFMMGDDFSLDRLIASNTVSQSAVESIYKVQRYYLGNSGTNPPLFLVNGNHEQAARYLLNGTDQNAAVQAALARKKYFPLPSPDGFFSGDKDTVAHVGLLKDYYAFEWGSALFVVIDPYWHSETAVDNQPGSEEGKKKKDPWSATLGETQYNWLKKTLETSKATFKFVFAHHVNGTGRGGVERADLFEWGGKGQNGQWQFDQFRKGWAYPIHQLMVKNKVTIFFQGHDHLFAKQEKDGIIYQSVPNPADDTHTAFNREAYTSGIILPNSGFLKVTVGSKEVKVDYVRTYNGDASSLSSEIKDPYSYRIGSSTK